jgi:hypothetical protein
MDSARRPRWQQVTALVSLSAGGAITGFNFVPKPAAELKSPTAMPIHLMALEKSAQPAASHDTALRSAIVNVANHYLRLAQNKTPAEMQDIIWRHVSVDGVDHGPSCAAFASLALELGANAVGEQSWVTGGTTYPWPLHKWADARVDPNPGSLGITSIVQDAQAHDRWHPLGDRYRPLPGDWVLFEGHVEVVTRYASGVLYTVGGDSVPNMSVNAHRYRVPLGPQGVTGFVDNGSGASAGVAAAAPPPAGRPPAGPQDGAADIPGQQSFRPVRTAAAPPPGGTLIPGMRSPHHDPPHARRAHTPPAAPAHTAAAPGSTDGGLAAIPGVRATGAGQGGHSRVPGVAPPPRQQPGPKRHAGNGAPAAPAAGDPAAGDTTAQQAFIRQIAPGAAATQRKYGIPAAVTIAQAIEESGWGRSSLASEHHNLFGMKGAGPAGSVTLPSQEYEGGSWITRDSSFRVYQDLAQSIDDHARQLATDEAYRRAMSVRRDPDAFAAALTGVYATDPGYGTKLVDLMRHYDLYRYDTGAAAQPGRNGGAAGHRQQPQPGSRTSGPTPGKPRVDPGTPGVAAPTPDVSPGSPRAHAGPPGTSPGGPDVSPGSPDSPGGGASPGPAASPAATTGGAAIPGLRDPSATSPGQPGASQRSPRWPDKPASRPTQPSRTPSQEPQAGQPTPGTLAPQSSSARRLQARQLRAPRTATRRAVLTSAELYEPQIPASVQKAFATSAKRPLARAEGVYQDVCSGTGLRWELLAACDWMQCEAKSRYSPVHGERLGTANPDGTVFHTRSAALEQCADDLIRLAYAVYGIDLTLPGEVSVRDLAKVFGAFRWGALLRLHHTSAMEFPYSVAGLTANHTRMRWPSITEANLPDKPGGRFHRPFGAVPVALMLNYPATA